MVIFIGMMFAYGFPLSWRILLAPLFAGYSVIAALSVGVWLAALNAKYRDVRYAVPFMAQVWMFLTPVAYPTDKMIALLDRAGLPPWLYPLNPMVGVVEGFRWSLLGQGGPAMYSVGLSVAVILLLLTGGLLYFRSVERTFADVV